MLILQGGKLRPRKVWFFVLFFVFNSVLLLDLGDTTETSELRSKPRSSKSRSKFITTLAGCTVPCLTVHTPWWVQQGSPKPRERTAGKSLGLRPQVQESLGPGTSTHGRSMSLRAGAGSSLCAFLPERLLVPRR